MNEGVSSGKGGEGGNVDNRGEAGAGSGAGIGGKIMKVVILVGKQKMVAKLVMLGERSRLKLVKVKGSKGIILND